MPIDKMLQLIISAINIMIGISKINEGDKNKLTCKTLKNRSRVNSKRDPCVNENTTISQNVGKAIIVKAVKNTVLTLDRSKHSTTR